MSEKTIVQKLAIKEGQRLLLINAPEGYQTSLADLPTGATLTTDRGATADVIQCFVTWQAQLESLLPTLKGGLSPKGILWIAYPKGTSKMKADLNRDTIRAFAQTVGMEAVALFAIDDNWSSLRLKVV